MLPDLGYLRALPHVTGAYYQLIIGAFDANVGNRLWLVSSTVYTVAKEENGERMVMPSSNEDSHRLV